MASQSSKVTTARGTRDFLPEQMIVRSAIINSIKKIFEKYGFEPLETPSIERLDVLTDKYGEEGDQLIFKILKRGTGLEKVGVEIDEFTVKNYNEIIDLGLRYDLTVPLCRVIAMHRNKLVFPFRRYQIQPVWRADKPQKGRYREFYQCDVDIIGSSSMLADTEIIFVGYKILKELGFKKFSIRINNRKVLNGILEYCNISRDKSFSVLASVDKLDKIGKNRVIEELKDKNIPDKSIHTLFDILSIEGDHNVKLNELKSLISQDKDGEEGIEELGEIFSSLVSYGMDENTYSLNLSLSRGLQYYTGPIYEAVVEEPQIGSLMGGGRYDKLIGMFLKEEIPATGTSFGIERIVDVMTQLEMVPQTKTISRVLVTVFSDELKHESINTAATIRKLGINTELFAAPLRLNKQLSYANKKGIPYVCIIGPDELEKEEIKIKHMETGKEDSIKKDALSEYFKDI